MNLERVFKLTLSLEGNVLKTSSEETLRPEEAPLAQYEQHGVNLELVNTFSERVLGALLTADQNGCLSRTDWADFQDKCAALYAELLGEHTKQKLQMTEARFLLLSIDDNLVHIPWEVLYDGRTFMAQRFAMGRRVRTQQPVYQPAFRAAPSPARMLVLADPTGDLPAAYEEGQSILKHLSDYEDAIEVDLKMSAIDVAYVVEKLKSYDLVHYAGHAEHSARDPENSAWVLRDGRLRASDIAKLGGGKAPPLVVFSNACESGMTKQWRSQGSDLIHNVRNVYGLANAFLLAGVRHYVGSFVHLRDDKASGVFAQTFYENLLQGKALGEALRLSRQKIATEGPERNVAWATYVLYGSPAMRIFSPVSGEETVEVSDGPVKYAKIDESKAPIVAMSSSPRDGSGLLFKIGVAGSALALLLAGLASWPLLKRHWPGPAVSTNATLSAVNSSVPVLHGKFAAWPDFPLSGPSGKAQYAAGEADGRSSAIRQGLVRAVHAALPADIRDNPKVETLLQTASAQMLSCRQYVRGWKVTTEKSNGELSVQVQPSEDAEPLARMAVLEGQETDPDMATLYKMLGSPRILVDVADRIDGAAESKGIAQQVIEKAFRDAGFEVCNRESLTGEDKAGAMARLVSIQSSSDATGQTTTVQVSWGRDAGNNEQTGRGLDIAAVRRLSRDYKIQLVVAGVCESRLIRELETYPGIPSIKDYRSDLHLALFWAPTGSPLSPQRYSDQGVPLKRGGESDARAAAVLSMSNVIEGNRDDILAKVGKDWLSLVKDESAATVTLENCTHDDANRLYRYLGGLGQGIKSVPEARRQFANGTASFEVIRQGPKADLASLLPGTWLEVIATSQGRYVFRGKPVAENGWPRMGNFGIAIRRANDADLKTLVAELEAGGCTILQRKPTEDSGYVFEISSYRPLGDLVDKVAAGLPETSLKLVSVNPPWIILAKQ